MSKLYVYYASCATFGIGIGRLFAGCELSGTVLTVTGIVALVATGFAAAAGDE